MESISFEFIKEKSDKTKFGKNRTYKLKENLFYVLSLLTASEYLIRLREQMQRSFWF
jgi:hypothetical protein